MNVEDYTSNTPLVVPSKSVIGNNYTLGQQSQTPQMEQTALINLKSPAASHHGHHALGGSSKFNSHSKRARSIASNILSVGNSNYDNPSKYYHKVIKGGSPGGILMQENMYRSKGWDDDKQNGVVDYIKKNITLGKEHKNIDFERQKQLIAKVHNKIKRRKDYGLDVNNLFNVQSCLPPKVKQHFSSDKGFYQIFTETNVLNQSFLQIIDQVSCYKLELGLTLQKLIESYNSIILLQFEEFYKSDGLKDKEVNHKLIHQQQATEDLISKRLEYERKLEQVQAVISSKDAQINSLIDTESQLEKEIQYLREMLSMGSSTNKLRGSAGGLTDVPLSSVNMDFSHKPLESIDEKAQQQKAAKEELSNNIEDLNEVLQGLDKEQNEKKNILNGMDRLLKKMLKTTNQSVGTQVDDGELIWKPQNFVGEGSSQQLKMLQSQTKIVKQSSKALPSEQEIQTYKSMAENIKSSGPSQESEKSQQDDNLIKSKSKLYYEAPMETYANTKKILMEKEDEKLADLESKMNQMSSQIKIPDSETNNGEQQQQLKYTWSVPPHILVFIANSLELNQSGRVLPWIEFKQIIFDIYDHRIQHAGEINGIANNTYVGFEEYIILYFLDKHKLRRLAEVKIIEMLTSLKYYVEIWPRAKILACLLNLMKPQKPEVSQIPQQKRNTKANHSQIELNIPTVDIYLQEFFLHAYSIVMQDKDHFLESKDGITYVRIQSEENFTQILMTWFGDQDSRKWFHKVRRSIRKIKTNALDDFETDYIDVDVLLNLYLEEFKQRKKTNQKNLSKEFMKKYQEQDGLFNTDELDKIVLACIPSTSQSAFVKFPSFITIRRAFLYALVCGDNGFEINTQEFIAACNRFGLDNPAPIVTKRVGLYGNDEDFEEILKRELIKANLAQQNKIHTTKMKKMAIKLENARLSTSNIREPEMVNSNTSHSRLINPGIQNLKLIGKGNTSVELEPQLVVAGGVKLNIGQLGKDTKNEQTGNTQKRVMSQEENSINNKKIIIPSFSTTSALFSQHFSILRDLKKRIEGLKQAYYNQREEERSWEQVEKILHVLETACKFLDFPIQN